MERRGSGSGDVGRQNVDVQWIYRAQQRRVDHSHVAQAVLLRQRLLRWRLQDQQLHAPRTKKNTQTHFEAHKRAAQVRVCSLHAKPPEMHGFVAVVADIVCNQHISKHATHVYHTPPPFTTHASTGRMYTTAWGELGTNPAWRAHAAVSAASESRSFNALDRDRKFTFPREYCAAWWVHPSPQAGQDAVSVRHDRERPAGPAAVRGAGRAGRVVPHGVEGQQLARRRVDGLPLVVPRHLGDRFGRGSSAVHCVDGVCTQRLHAAAAAAA